MSVSMYLSANICIYVYVYVYLFICWRVFFLGQARFRNVDDLVLVLACYSRR